MAWDKLSGGYYLESTRAALFELLEAIDERILSWIPGFIDTSIKDKLYISSIYNTLEIVDSYLALIIEPAGIGGTYAFVNHNKAVNGKFNGETSINDIVWTEADLLNDIYSYLPPASRPTERFLYRGNDFGENTSSLKSIHGFIEECYEILNRLKWVGRRFGNSSISGQISLFKGFAVGQENGVRSTISWPDAVSTLTARSWITGGNESFLQYGYRFNNFGGSLLYFRADTQAKNPLYYSELNHTSDLYLFAEDMRQNRHLGSHVVQDHIYADGGLAELEQNAFGLLGSFNITDWPTTEVELETQTILNDMSGFPEPAIASRSYGWASYPENELIVSKYDVPGGYTYLN